MRAERAWSGLEYMINRVGWTAVIHRKQEYIAHQLCDHQAAAGNGVVEDAVRRMVARVHRRHLRKQPIGIWELTRVITADKRRMAMAGCQSR
jgi:hypothetical protein